MIKLYSKNVCPKCLFVKAELEGNEIEYEVLNIDVDEDAKNKVIEAGFMATPILEVDGKFIGDYSEIMNKVRELSE